MTTSAVKATIGTRWMGRPATDFCHATGYSLTLTAISGGSCMKTVILDVCTPKAAMADALAAVKSGKPQKSARISFATPELLWRVLTAKRWELLKALCGAGPVSIREAARRVGRDVKAVHSDVTACSWRAC